MDNYISYVGKTNHVFDRFLTVRLTLITQCGFAVSDSCLYVRVCTIGTFLMGYRYCLSVAFVYRLS